MEKVLCVDCGDFVNYHIKVLDKDSIATIKGEQIRYKEKIAYCNKCGNPVWVSDIEYENAYAPVRIYCHKHNIKED